MNENYLRKSNLIGIFLVLLFTVCFIWFYVRSVESDLHLRSLRLAFVGFNQMNVVGFIAGAIQSYIWAYVGVGLWRLAKMISKSGN